MTITAKKVSKYTVTIIEGFKETMEIDTLCSKLKSAIGAGGTTKNGVIELQGDHTANEKMFAVLKDEGFTKTLISA